MIFNPSALIFSPYTDFTQKALTTFNFQYANNEVYKRFADALNCDPSTVNSVDKIPFLPVSFFKTHPIITTSFNPDTIFSSSGTTNSVTSKHFVKDLRLYEESFITAFELRYGPVNDYCILGLLPSYLEREGSSLIYMVEKMMKISTHKDNGFYLTDFSNLAGKLKKLGEANQKTLLIGVSFALLDFAESCPMPLNNVIVMETGGMKGRKKELVRTELHQLLQSAFDIKHIHSEYGMTELLSQAYAESKGNFTAPPWMKILIRQEDDPLKIIAFPERPVIGGINIIDLANLYSCSFIATDDIGKLHPDGSFEVLGRFDNSDVRGCSLMVN
jgi:phenylacetate-coenzyme A ligase PaaK-like adenylate-forming protein